MYSRTPRRKRTIFHYKLDAILRPEDRQAYLDLARAPRTRNEDAHAWLLQRGYALSLSAVARHRRRLIAGDAEYRNALQKTLIFAQVAGSPGAAADFTAAARFQLQQLVCSSTSSTSATECAKRTTAKPTRAPA